MPGVVVDIGAGGDADTLTSAAGRRRYSRRWRLRVATTEKIFRGDEYLLQEIVGDDVFHQQFAIVNRFALHFVGTRSPCSFFSWIPFRPR